MTLLDSKVYQDFLNEGKLPTVETSVSLENQSIIKFSIAMFILAVAILAVNKIFKTL